MKVAVGDIVKFVNNVIGDLGRWHPSITRVTPDHFYIEEYCLTSPAINGNGVWSLDVVTYTPGTREIPPDYDFATIETSEDPFKLIRVALKRIMSERVDNVVDGLQEELHEPNPFSASARPGGAAAPAAPAERPDAPGCVPRAAPGGPRRPESGSA